MYHCRVSLPALPQSNPPPAIVGVSWLTLLKDGQDQEEDKKDEA